MMMTTVTGKGGGGGGERSVSVIKAEKPPPGEMGKTLSNAIKEKQRNTASPPTHI